MVPNKSAVLNLELDLIQFAKIQPFLDPSQPFFQLKLFCSNQQIFENLQSEIRKNNIKIHSLDINFPSQHKKNGVSETKDDFLSNLEESSANFKQSKDEDEDEEEKKGLTPKSEPLEKIISKVDEIKLLYIRANNKLEEIQEDLQEDDPSLQITIDSDNIIVKGDKKIVHKAERKLRMFLNNLVFRNFDKKFNKEAALDDFLNQEFVQDILMDSGVKALEITPKCQLKSRVNDFSLVFFIEDKDRSSDLEEAIRSLLSHRSYEISLNKFLTQNLSEVEKLRKKKTLQIKYDYIKGFLEKDLKEMAMALRLKFQDIIMENKAVILKLEGEDEQMDLFSNDLSLFFKNLRTITLKSQVFLKKRIYHEVILENLEILEEKHFNPEMENKKYPVILGKKYDEEEQCVFVTLVSFTGKDKMEELTNLAKQIQDTINYTERNVKLPHAVFKKFKKPEHLRSLENEFLVDLSLDHQKKEISIIGNIEQIKLVQDHIKNEELEALREKAIYRFDNLLIFFIFCKYELDKLPEALKNQGLVIDNPIIKKESKSFEFLVHPDNKQKISSCIDEIIVQIQHNIGTKVVKYSGKASYKILSDPFFIKNLINFPNDSKSFANMIPVDIITNQQKLKNMKLMPTATSQSSFSNLTEFNYKDLVKINLHDSNFPSEIELKGLIINIDVKGSYLDKNSEKIAETSETNRFVAKEINKLNDNNLNKKKRAEVYPIVECRNPSKNYKIFKMFYSIMKHKKLMSNPNINKEVYSMTLDNTKRIVQDPQKFTYRKNLENIFKSALDDKYESLGIMVPNDEFLDDLSMFLQEFCKNNAEFTSLKNIHIFTNDNKESTYLSNKFRPFFTSKNEINPVVPPKNNILVKNNNMKKLRWKYLDNNIEIYFNETDNQNINFAYQMKAPEFLLVKRLQQSQTDNEIYLNLIENKATNLAQYKPMNFDKCVKSSSYLTRLVDNYMRLGIPNVTYYEGNSVFYRLDFKTNKVEQIEFKFSSFPLMTEEGKEEEMDFFSGNNEENEKVSLFYGITGYSIDIDEAEAKIMQEFSKLKKEEVYVMPKNLEDSIGESIFNLVNDRKKGNMELSYQQIDKKIIMKGTKEDISEAISIIAHAVADEISKFVEQIERLEFPKEWVPQDDYFKLVKLEQTDKDYLMVKRFFDKTMNGAKIYSIKRIQNKSLFNLYWNAKQHLSKNKSMINEKYLFHGTSENNPKEIYKGRDCGFDMRLSKDGMWGKAIYFAENASYTNNNYAFTAKKSKRKKILLAYVLVGETVAVDQDANSQKLTRPPFKNAKNLEFYDSVQGETSGSTVFMIYDNNRAYPAFIISYT